MKLTLTNSNLLTLITILEKVKPTSMKVNRGRARLIKRTKEKLVDYQKDELDVLGTYIQKDENGNLIRNENGTFPLNDPDQASELNEKLAELANEEIIIDAGEESNRFIDFFDWLEEAEDDFTADEAILIDELLEQHEEKKGE